MKDNYQKNSQSKTWYFIIHLFLINYSTNYLTPTTGLPIAPLGSRILSKSAMVGEMSVIFRVHKNRRQGFSLKAAAPIKILSQFQMDLDGENITKTSEGSNKVNEVMSNYEGLVLDFESHKDITSWYISPAPPFPCKIVSLNFLFALFHYNSRQDSGETSFL